MSKKLYFVLVLPIFFTFFFFGINLPKSVKAEQSDFESFLTSYQQMIKDDTFLENYEEKLLDYDDILSYDNQNMVETEILEDKLNDISVVEQKVSDTANTLSINISKNQYVLKKEKTEFKLENILLEDEKVFVSVDEVASKLGYEIFYNESNIKIVNPYETKRIMVYSKEKLDKQNAIKFTTVYDDMQILQYETEEATKTAYYYYKNLKSVYNVCLDSVVTTLDAQSEPMGLNDSFSYKSWGAGAMNVQDYSNYLLSKSQESNLAPVYVAVLDTGIDTDNPWFNNRIKFDKGINLTSSPSSTSYPFEDFEGNPNESEEERNKRGHGTHVSGIIVDLTLKNVQIIPVKVIGNDGLGYKSDIIAGINYVKELKNSGLNVCAMNMSLGSDISIGSADYNAYKTAIEAAYNIGILTVVAAGNGDSNGVAVNASTNCPANIEKAITVSAVGQSGSSYTHPTWSNYGDLVDVSAPGKDVISAKIGGGITSMSGTSMAAPHVSAAIALLFSDPTKNYTISNIEEILQTNVIDLGDEGKDIYFGEGMVNLQYAYIDLLKNVVFSNTNSTCTEEFDLTLTNQNPDAEIYYTTDGTKPTKTNGTKYTEPIHIGSSITITAAAYIFDGDNMVTFSRPTQISYYFSNIDTKENYKINDGVLVEYTGSLEFLLVPREVNGQEITKIGDRAFYQNTTIKSVSLAKEITEIGESAFYGCGLLENIQAQGVEKVGSRAFYECISLTKLNDANFNKLETIGQQAFYNCYNLEEIVLPNVKAIDYQAFCMGLSKISKLKIINLPLALTIGEEAFVYCDGLDEVYLPKVTTICSDAFYACSIKTISLPEVKYLGNYAFYQNINLSSVSIPKAEIICSYCFCECALTEIEAPNVTFVGKCAFLKNGVLVNIVMPNLIQVGESAFEDCSKLKTISSQNIQTIDSYGFYRCLSLEEISLPSIIQIGGGAFFEAPLKKVILSPCLEWVGYSAFKNIDNSCEFYIYKSTVEEYLTQNEKTYIYLDDEMSLFKYKVVLNEIYITGYNCSSEEVIIPSFINGKKVTTICSGSFLGCEGLKTINLCGLTTIEDNAFMNCSNLTHVKANNLNYIGNNAFKNCENLSYISLNNAITIGDEAFFNCSKLLYATLGQNIQNIGDRAFAYLPQNNEDIYEIVENFVLYGMNDVAENYVLNTNQENTDGTINGTITFVANFYELTENDFIYDINSTLLTSTIEITSVNKAIVGNIIIPNSLLVDGNELSITTIGESAFDDCSFITSIILPNTIKTIKDGGFQNCSALKSINLDDVESIGQGAFSGCDSLNSVYAPKLQKISINCFLNCGSLTYVNIPNVKNISAQAFANCFSLKEVSSPSVTKIYYAAFYSCFSLEKIDLNKVEYLGYSVYRNRQNGTLKETNNFFSNDEELTGYTFAYCKSLKSLTMNKVICIYSNSFINSNIKNVVLGSMVQVSPTYRSFTQDMTIYGKNLTNAQTIATMSGCNYVELESFNVNITNSLNVGQYQTQILQATTNGYDVTYQWYQEIDGDDDIILTGETNSYLILNTQELGIFKYYVKVTNFDGTTINSSTATVEVYESYLITIQEQGLGVVNQNYEQFYAYDSQTFLLTPRIGYYVKDIKINDVSIDQGELENLENGGEYTLENISGDITFLVIFEIYKYDITFSSNDKGSLSVDNIAEWGTDKKITLYPNDCYGIKYIKVNGEKIAITDDIVENNEFWVRNIKENINIEVYYDNKFEITIQTEDGTLSESKIVNFGENLVVNIEPNKGYEISDVIIDGNSVSNEVLNSIKQTNSYTFSSVKTEHTISVCYSLQTFKIIYKILEGEGDVSFDKNIESISYGDSRTIIIEPKQGYYIGGVYINGVKVKPDSDGTYKINNITGDLSIEVKFVDESKKDISLTAVIFVIVSGFVIVCGAMLILFRYSQRLKNTNFDQLFDN